MVSITCYNINMKKYEIIYNDLVKKIDSREYSIGDSIPSENELSNTYGASRVTVRKSLAELEKHGIIMKQQGKESIVVNNSIKTKTVLLILPNLFVYIFVDLIREIQNTLRSYDINLLIACSYNNQKVERDIIRNNIGVVDGIILEPTQSEYTKHIHSKSYASLTTKPTVCTNSNLEHMNLPHLLVDEKQSTTLLTKEVLKRGARKILILAKTDDFQGISRLNGILSVLDQQNDINKKIIEFTTYNEKQKLVEFGSVYLHYRPDTIMFYNDEYAYRFMNQYNINPIVDDIIITGFDNTEYSNGYPYTFLSPDHPKEQMGYDAANMIVKLLNGEPVESKIYPASLNIDK